MRGRCVTCLLTMRATLTRFWGKCSSILQNQSFFTCSTTHWLEDACQESAVYRLLRMGPGTTREQPADFVHSHSKIWSNAQKWRSTFCMKLFFNGFAQRFTVHSPLQQLRRSRIFFSEDKKNIENVLLLQPNLRAFKTIRRRRQYDDGEAVDNNCGRNTFVRICRQSLWLVRGMFSDDHGWQEDNWKNKGLPLSRNYPATLWTCMQKEMFHPLPQLESMQSSRSVGLQCQWSQCSTQLNFKDKSFLALSLACQTGLFFYLWRDFKEGKRKVLQEITSLTGSQLLLILSFLQLPCCIGTQTFSQFTPTIQSMIDLGVWSNNCQSSKVDHIKSDWLLTWNDRFHQHRTY